MVAARRLPGHHSLPVTAATEAGTFNEIFCIRKTVYFIFY